MGKKPFGKAFVPSKRMSRYDGGLGMATAPTTLKELYIADLRDLWSANDQMQRVVQSFSERAQNEQLKQLFKKSVTGINQHTQALQQLVQGQDASPSPGMQGLVAEATKHALESDLPPALRDLEMIAQYQRMSHYGLAGFGTAAAYADALGQDNEAKRLRSIVSDIYSADEYSSQLAHFAHQTASNG
jgi:ferritin-like metal-binding protein YciE